MSDCCGSTSKKTIILACSGAADVGALADRTARALAKDGKGALFCLAAVGAKVEGKLKEFMSVDEIITIDGCSVGCAKTMALNAGRTPVAFDLGVLGYVKGKTPVSDDVVYEASSHIALKLAGPAAGETSASRCCS
jgi:uncharacterized metal-binding protein